MLNVYCYWDRGYDFMPDMIKYIHNYNVLICKKYNMNMILITKANVRNYIDNVPDKFETLIPCFQSDIVRFFMLHKTGGIWIDCDVILLKDMNNLYNSLLNSNKDCILDSECEVDNEIVIGCCTIMMKPNTKCSKYCIDYMYKLLNENANREMKWLEFGMVIIKQLYINNANSCILNLPTETGKGCNYIGWYAPGYDRSKWMLKNKLNAFEKAVELYNNSSCNYIISWTIYSQNNIQDNIIDYIFNKENSLFKQLLILQETPYLVIKNCILPEHDGPYFEYKDKINIKTDENVPVYINSENHYLYRFNGFWHLLLNNKMNITLYDCINQTWNIAEYDCKFDLPYINNVHTYNKIYDYITTYTDINNKTDKFNLLFWGVILSDDFDILIKCFPNANIHCVNAFVDKSIKLNNKNVTYYKDIDDIKVTFDLILCLSVFPNINFDADIYPFYMFEHSLSLINKKLNVDGILTLTNTKYIFEETDISKKYIKINTDVSKNFDTCNLEHVKNSDYIDGFWMPKISKNNILQKTVDDGFIYKKIE